MKSSLAHLIRRSSGGPGCLRSGGSEKRRPGRARPGTGFCRKAAAEHVRRSSSQVAEASRNLPRPNLQVLEARGKIPGAFRQLTGVSGKVPGSFRQFTGVSPDVPRPFWQLTGASRKVPPSFRQLTEAPLDRFDHLSLLNPVHPNNH